MDIISSRVTKGNLGLLAKTDLTIDMVKNLLTMFEASGPDDPVTLELREWGVWAVTTEGVRLFIGATEQLPDDSGKRKLNS